MALLEGSRAFASNACVDAMAAALGVSHLTTALAGSMQDGAAVATPPAAAAAADAPGVAPPAAAAAAAEAAKQAVWRQVDGAWADEAVRRGVSLAKSGAWGGAHRHQQHIPAAGGAEAVRQGSGA
jgi:hypothetical protein